MLLVVRLSTLSLNVLLNAVNSRLVGDQTLLDFVEAVVDLVLEDHVAPGVVLHGVERRLLGKTSTVGTNLLSNGLQASLFGLMGGLELTDTSELVGHLVLHLVDVLGVHFHLLVHAALQVSDLVEVGASCLNLNLKLGSGRLSLA